MHPYDTPGMDMDMHPGMQMNMHREMRTDILTAHTRPSPFNVFRTLAPNNLAAALSVMYAFGGTTPAGARRGCYGGRRGHDAEHRARGPCERVLAGCAGNKT